MTQHEEKVQAVLKHFLPTEGFPAEKWAEDLKDSLDCYGCDWLVHFIEHHNPDAAESIENLCYKYEKLKREFDALNSSLH